MSFFHRLFGKSKPPALANASPRALRSDEMVAEMDRAISALYGQQKPFHYGVMVGFAEGGPDPLDGVSIYWNEDGPHWHYISFGMHPLGFELTFRLKANPSDMGTDPASFLGSIAYQAPVWPIQMLNMLARRVHRTGRRFGHGHWWQAPPGGAKWGDAIDCLVFAQDPQLGVVPTPNGQLVFLQAAAADPQSIEEMKQDEIHKRGDAHLDRLLASNPLLITKI